MFAALTKITASNGAANDQFGTSVAISGNGEFALSVASNNGGAAYIFRRNGDGTWTEETKIAIANGRSASLSDDGTRALVGRDEEAFIYTRNNSTGTWTQEARITASDGEANSVILSPLVATGSLLFQCL